jgi:hypothetical protein
MVPVGLHGKNKSEVASWILREWIWHNQEDLARVGVRIGLGLAPKEPDEHVGLIPKRDK